MKHQGKTKASDSVSCYYSALRSRHRWVPKHPTGNSNLLRCTCLVSYGLVDLTRFPIRKGLGKWIKKHFNSGSGKFEVMHWACAKRKHQNSREHYRVFLIKGDSSKTLENRKRTYMIE